MVYKTIKPDGTVVYSDVPSEGASAVKLSAMNSVVMPALNSAAKQPKNQANKVKRQKPETQYLVSISSPEAEQTLRDSTGAVTIKADVSPKSAGKFQLVLDSKVVKTQTNNTFQLENIERGAHNIQVHFLSQSGKILASSKPQTFYQQKVSVLINAARAN